MHWSPPAIGRRTRDLGAGLALFIALAACGLGTNPVSREPSSPAPATPPANTKDAAFAAHVRASGWAPNVPANQDGAIAIDAQSFCDELASQPDDVNSVRNNMRNTAKDDSATRGTTGAQAQALLLFSARTYCPDKVSMVQRAFR